MIAFKGYTDINEVEKYKGCICLWFTQGYFFTT